MSQRNNSPVKSSGLKKHPPRTAIKKFSNYQPSQTSNNNSAAQAIPTLTNTSDQDREGLCDICAQNVPGPEREAIFAFGKCDHYVCYVCSTRMRVICDQPDCPICREKLDNVIFSSTRKRSYEKYNLKDLIFIEKYRIYFENRSLLKSFEKLLTYECLECLKLHSRDKSSGNNNHRRRATGRADKDELQKFISNKESSSNSDKRQTKSACSSPIIQDSTSCENGNGDDQKDGKRNIARGSSELVEKIKDEGQGLLEPAQVMSKVFPDVYGLMNHLNIVHELKLCKLCLEHDKLFPYEYSYYTKEALEQHRLEGEPKTSHRGHPTCKLCHGVFFNADELLQHMSREHFHCHLCGRHDSPYLIYFLTYGELRTHFQEKHFLCVRDSCQYEQFTSAFDSIIDYQLHQAHAHPSASLSRGEARQQRTITLDSAPHRSPRITNQTRHQDLPQNAAIVSTGNMATANSSRHLLNSNNNIQLRQQRLPTRAEFPSLGNNNSPFVVPPMISQTSGPSLSIYNFPNLGPTHATQSQSATTTNATSNGTSSSSASMSQRLLAGPSSSHGSFVRSAGGGLRSAAQLNEMDFPPLPEQPKAKSKKSKKQNSYNSKSNDASLSLDQLISSSLTLSSNKNSSNGKKSGSKGAGSSSAKKVKQKPLKIQLS